MRRLVVLLLTGLLFACPFVCGADEIGHGAKHGAASGDAGGDHLPDQCPEGGDNCVCRGAVPLSDAKAITRDAMVVDSLYVPAPQARLVPPAHHLTLDGSPTGLAGWGDALTVRAYLQNFRF